MKYQFQYHMPHIFFIDSWTTLVYCVGWSGPVGALKLPNRSGILISKSVTIIHCQELQGEYRPYKQKLIQDTHTQTKVITKRYMFSVRIRVCVCVDTPTCWVMIVNKYLNEEKNRYIYILSQTTNVNHFVLYYCFDCINKIYIEFF